MLDRYGVTTGNLENQNLAVSAELPEALSEQSDLDEKRRREQQKLYTMVQYAKATNCRRAFIHEYFGLRHGGRCGACDCCQI